MFAFDHSQVHVRKKAAGTNLILIIKYMIYKY